MSTHAGRHQLSKTRKWPHWLVILAAAAALVISVISWAGAHASHGKVTVQDHVPAAQHPVTVQVHQTTVVHKTVISPVSISDYTVAVGDTLWGIAAKEYLPVVEEYNRALLDRQHGVIYEGQTLRLPVLRR